MIRKKNQNIELDSISNIIFVHSRREKKEKGNQVCLIQMTKQNVSSAMQGVHGQVFHKNETEIIYIHLYLT